jgi:CRISPR system Cascade subunit CasB
MTDAPWLAVEKATVGAIMPLQSGYTRTPRNAAAVRDLARLRHADINLPGSDPALWELTLGSLPEELLGRGDDEPSPAERAVHAALVLYSIHQQSRPEPMHRKGAGLGQAVRILSGKRSDGADWDPGTVSRFQHMCRAQSSAIRLENLRGLITLMRSESVGLDYGRLAADLWSIEAGNIQRTILSWGRQLHHREHDTSNQPATEGDQK